MKTPCARALLPGLSLALALSLSCAGTEEAPLAASPPQRSVPPQERSSSILQGFPSLGDPEVFLLVIETDTGTYLCSSTLIGQRTLLTAAHCVIDATSIVASNQLKPIDPVTTDFSPDFVYIQARGWLHHPAYDPYTFANDIAMVGLEQVPSVSPKPWNTTSISDWLAQTPLRLVGFGESAIGAHSESGYGLKRTGYAFTEQVRTTQLELQPGKAVTCFGDSGGPSFHIFPDGVERLVGITSFGDQFCGESETETRVDAFVDFVQSTLAMFDPPSCDADGLCVPGCMPADVDCTCASDGVCNTDCPDPSTDPDCDAACVANNLCARAACGVTDPDCKGTGSACMTASDCAGAACVTDGQHPESYCSHSCTGDGDCESGYSCQSDTCRHIALPEAAPNAVCTPGSQFCTGNTVCARPVDGGVVQCRQPCGLDSECPTNEHCAGDPDATYCDTVVAVQPTTPPPDSKGCSSVGGLPGVWALLVAAAWWGTRRRRRTVLPGAAH
jgi:uncharacterized protein (TIGR03382 family)